MALSQEALDFLWGNDGNQMFRAWLHAQGGRRDEVGMIARFIDGDTREWEIEKDALYEWAALETSKEYLRMAGYQISE